MATEPRIATILRGTGAPLRRTPPWDGPLADALFERLGSEEQVLVGLVNPVGPVTPLPPGDRARLMRLIAAHGLAGRIVARAGRLAAGGVLPEIIDGCIEAHRAAAARMLLLAHEESRVQELLAREGIETIPLKGATLARLLYNNPTARPATDMDLGVRAGDVPAAARLLAAQGYTCSTAMEVLSHRPFLAHAGEHTSEAIFSRLQAGVPLILELHWNLLLLPEKEIWPGLREYRVAGDAPRIRTLSPTTYFLYLCAHISGHGWAGLRWLADAGEFLAQFAGELDAEEFLRLTAAARLRFRVGVTLLLLHAYFGLRWPPGERAVDARARRVAERYLLRPLSNELEQSAAAIHLERMRVADNWPDRARYLAWLARPTRIEYDGGSGIRPWPAAWLVRAGRLAALAWKAVREKGVHGR